MTLIQRSSGDVLVFLTGREEIDRCLEGLAELLPTCVLPNTRYSLIVNVLYRVRLPRGATRLKLHALHSGLPMDEQLAAFEPAERGFRKVIVSTNIAEVIPLTLCLAFCADNM